MIVVVGGHSRNVGKTSVMASLIRGIPDARWTAVKITQFGHGICSSAGKPCDCAIRDCRHPYALTEELDRAGSTDTARFLAAGASRSWWLRTASGELRHAMPALERLIGESENLILESNSVIELIRPDAYVVVVDAAVKDVKETSRRYIARANALVFTGRHDADWLEIGERPVFQAPPPRYTSRELIDWVLTLRQTRAAA